MPPKGDSAADELPTKSQSQLSVNKAQENPKKNRLTSIDTNHASLQILKQPPRPIHILGEEITSQPHTSVVSSFHHLLLSLKRKQRKHRRKSLFTRNQHAPICVPDNRWLHEVSLCVFCA